MIKNVIEVLKKMIKNMIKKKKKVIKKQIVDIPNEMIQFEDRLMIKKNQKKIMIKKKEKDPKKVTKKTENVHPRLYCVNPDIPPEKNLKTSQNKL